jgi:peptide/nickel transport system substrate-binding protein
MVYRGGCVESLRDAWLRAPDLATQKAIAIQIQAHAFIDVPYLPLGEYFHPTATRKSLTGVLKGLPLFWNVKKEA